MISRVRRSAVLCNCWNDIMANSVTLAVLIGDHGLLVFAPYILIRYYNHMDILEALLAVFLIEATLPWTLIVLHLTGDYNTKSAGLLKDLVLASNQSGYHRKIYRSSRPCRVYFGSFFYFTKSSISGFLAITIDNLVTLLVSYK